MYSGSTSLLPKGWAPSPGLSAAHTKAGPLTGDFCSRASYWPNPPQHCPGGWDSSYPTFLFSLFLPLGTAELQSSGLLCLPHLFPHESSCILNPVLAPVSGFQLTQLLFFWPKCYGNGTNVSNSPSHLQQKGHPVSMMPKKWWEHY